MKIFYVTPIHTVEFAGFALAFEIFNDIDTAVYCFGSICKWSSQCIILHDMCLFQQIEWDKRRDRYSFPLLLKASGQAHVILKRSLAETISDQYLY